MKIPRLKYFDAFFITDDDGIWRELTPYELVARYNALADRHELVLEDMEEIVCGHQRRPEPTVYPGAASTA